MTNNPASFDLLIFFPWIDNYTHDSDEVLVKILDYNGDNVVDAEDLSNFEPETIIDIYSRISDYPTKLRILNTLIASGDGQLTKVLEKVFERKPLSKNSADIK